jgi:hypothetical protein
MSDAAVLASQYGQAAAADVAKVTQDYATIGVKKTQEVFDEYVAPTAQAGKTFRLSIVEFMDEWIFSGVVFSLFQVLK